MAPKSSKTTLRQSTLSFGAAKSSAAASKAKKASASTSKDPGSSSTRSKRAEKPSKVDADSSDEEVVDVDDIEHSKSDSESPESEIEDADAQAQAGPPTERAKGKTAAVKSEVSEDSALQSLEQKAKAEEKKPAIDVASRPHLNVKSAEYNDISRDTKLKMGHSRTIHGLKDQNRVDDILRIFDMDYEYGPCIGMTRLERWERAKAIGLNPPAEVYDILMTQEGLTKPRYSECVLAGQV